MTNSHLRFRMAVLDDAVHVQQLVEAAFRAEDSRERWTGDMELSANFRIDVKVVIANINDPNSAIILTTNDNNGLIACITISKRNDNRARFSMLAVNPDHNRLGIGRQVLNNAEDYCQQAWGAKMFEMNALSTREELILWYLRCGYRKTGESTPFPKEIMNGRPMADDLCFIELEKPGSIAVETP